MKNIFIGKFLCAKKSKLKLSDKKMTVLLPKVTWDLVMRNLCSGIRIKLSEIFLEVSYVGRYL